MCRGFDQRHVAVHNCAPPQRAVRAPLLPLPSPYHNPPLAPPLQEAHVLKTEQRDLKVALKASRKEAAALHVKLETTTSQLEAARKEATAAKRHAAAARSRSSLLQQGESALWGLTSELRRGQGLGGRAGGGRGAGQSRVDEACRTGGSVNLRRRAPLDSSARPSTAARPPRTHAPPLSAPPAHLCSRRRTPSSLQVHDYAAHPPRSAIQNDICLPGAPSAFLAWNEPT